MAGWVVAPQNIAGIKEWQGNACWGMHASAPLLEAAGVSEDKLLVW